MPQITTILFDLGNVIMDIDIPGATQRLEAFVDKSQASNSRKEMTVLVHAYETGKIQTEQFTGGLMKLVKPGITVSDIIEAWNSMLIGIPRYRLALLETLKERYSVYLLSNTNSLHLAWVRDHLVHAHGISDLDRRYLHGAYYSHLIGYRKPEPESYQYVIDDSFLTPARTLFIDDLPVNIKAAKQLGFQTHLSPSQEEIAEYLKLKGFY